MFLEPVKKVAIACPQCKTTIEINVPSNKDEFQKLQEQLDKFICPMCDTDLANIAKKLIEAVRTYNNAVYFLASAIEFTAYSVE